MSSFFVIYVTIKRKEDIFMSYKHKSKKILSFIMAVLIALSVAIIQVGAVANKEEPPKQIPNANAGTISPLWENANTPSLALSFSNKKIGLSVRITGKSGTKFKNGTVTVSKYSGGKYVPIKTWTGLSSAGMIFSFSNSELSATSGVKYKLEITITAYTAAKSEVITVNKVATCP